MTSENDSSEDQDFDIYLTKKELMISIANLAGLDEYDPDRAGEKTQYSRFTKEERRQIYEKLADESGDEYERKQLPKIILNEIGEELDSNFDDEFSRSDLKKVRRKLVDLKK